MHPRWAQVTGVCRQWAAGSGGTGGTSFIIFQDVKQIVLQKLEATSSLLNANVTLSNANQDAQEASEKETE